METIKLFDSELKVMEVIWQHNSCITAKEISNIIAEDIGWNKNTTYTVIKKLVSKGAIERLEPNFKCRSLITREQVQAHETRKLIDKLYDGSLKTFFASFIKKENLSQAEIEEIKDIIDKEL
ncbi:MAG: BlaI/MecI/CopY family transcriptional regulator [Vallitalea sp.]|jgi:predicted transcriptional regulator|nr:BlaI/MecI/CopY family transcriptional regulator [Vallitalea sp.]